MAQGIMTLLGFAMIALWIAWALWAGRTAMLIFRHIFNRRR